MNRPALFVVLVLASACKNAGAADPLAEQRKTCQQLANDKQLRAGVSVDDCARQLQQAESRVEPGRQAEELADRLQQLVAASHQRPDPSQEEQLNLVVSKLQGLGRAAVPPALSMMTTSIDPDLRAPLARVLTTVCAADCAAHKFDCIVPALLEGTSDDKPADVRRDSAAALAHCTGETVQGEASAWRKWWTDREARGPAGR
jgi:hypothetical protein